ncbi:hypothetical protein RCL_jg25226.t1 [Rhizophagus clarus]|uniref:Uncharacterized protein n=1 Tax=Rhizophagus clarus TaxID=94130 RepID=A0A8H3QCU8_9GLOM|nr:hypothetical protein RCL_jg25226.t1 [Rhizophagus clarus]
MLNKDWRNTRNTAEILLIYSILSKGKRKRTIKSTKLCYLFYPKYHFLGLLIFLIGFVSFTTAYLVFLDDTFLHLDIFRNGPINVKIKNLEKGC